MKKIVESLEHLVNIHEELLQLSTKKTEVIKAGSVEELQQLIIQERKLVRKVEQAEAERKAVVDDWYNSRKLPLEDATITDLLERLEEGESKEHLEQVTTDLTKTLADLKAQEKLNLALINQSMQFVKLSLDLLSPSLENMNYGNKPNVPASTRSIFDSKA